MRREIEGRPALWTLFALVLGMGAHHNAILLGGMLLSALVLIDGWGRRSIMALVALIGWFITTPDAARLEVRREFQGEADVVSMPRVTRYGQAAIVRSEGRRWQLYMAEDDDVALGDRVRVQGLARPLNESERRFIGHRALYGVISARGPVVAVEGALPVWRWGGAVRRHFLAFVRETLPSRTASVVDAMCFNVDARLEPALRRDLERSGAIHLISTSGVHVLIVATALAALFRFVPIPRWAQIGLLAVTILVYVAAAGLRAPAARSAVMALVLQCGFLVRREADGLSALAVAVTLYLLWSPEALLDIGLHLSVACVAGLFLFGPRLDAPTSPSLPALALQVAHASLAASLVAAPLVAYHFGYVSIASVATNVLLAPVVPVMLVGSLFAWLASFAAPAIGAGVMQVVVEPMVGFLLAVVRQIGGGPLSALEVPPFSGYWLPFAYCLIALLWQVRPRPAPRVPLVTSSA
jgi:competence protein ComEC